MDVLSLLLTIYMLMVPTQTLFPTQLALTLLTGKIILCNGWGICCSSTSAMSGFSWLPTTSLAWNKVSVSALPLAAATRTEAPARLRLRGIKLSLAFQYGKKMG